MHFHLLLAFVAFAINAAAVVVRPDAANFVSPRSPRSFDNALQKLLSPNATISHQLSSAPRWSEYHAPHPGTIVNVATERDVQVVVRSLLSPAIQLRSSSHRCNSVEKEKFLSLHKMAAMDGLARFTLIRLVFSSTCEDSIAQRSINSVRKHVCKAVP